MMKTIRAILMLFMLSTILWGNESNPVFRKFLVTEIAEKFDVPSQDVSIKLYHLPNQKVNHYQFEILNESTQLDIGYNRIYIKLLNDDIVADKIQITYNAKIEIMTPVVKEDIRFGEKINVDNLRMEKRAIKNNYHRYFRNRQIDKNMIANKLLRSGQVLTRSDLKRKPIIRRGQDVALKVLSGNILIEMNGIAKEAGFTGEKIRVYNQHTRKHYKGIIKSPQSVVINIE